MRLRWLPRVDRAGDSLGVAALAWLVLFAPGVGTSDVVPGPAPGVTARARPEGCRSVPAATALQPLLERASAGDAFCLEPGGYDGPIGIPAGVQVWGPRDAILYSTGKGTTVRLEGDGAALSGLTVDGSGGRFDLLDAAVRVEGDDVRIEGIRVQGAAFGILAEKSQRVQILGNEVIGDPERTLGLRGDGIRLWETHESRIEGNRVHDSRDMVVWYSSRNVIRGNEITDGRYGTHLMYSHGNTIEDNRFVGNVTGIFLMYSRDIIVERNLLAKSGGAAGIGLGVKESGNLRIVDNDFVHDTVGIYIDTSPLDEADFNVYQGNELRLCDTAVIFHGRASRNVFHDNTLRDNQVAVAVEGRGDALDSEWRGNDFDDYAGYDLDGDGFGDVPFELRSLSSALVAKTPSLAFFRGTAALGFAEAIGRIVPLFTPQEILVDPEPRVRPPTRGARPRESSDAG